MSELKRCPFCGSAADWNKPQTATCKESLQVRLLEARNAALEESALIADETLTGRELGISNRIRALKVPI